MLSVCRARHRGDQDKKVQPPPHPVPLPLTFGCLAFSFQHLDSAYVFLQLHFEHFVFSVGTRMSEKCILKLAT